MVRRGLGAADRVRLQRRLVEQALAARRDAFHAKAKASLLTETLFEINASRRSLEVAFDHLAHHAELLASQNRELEASNAAIEALSFGLAHDLTQPLAALDISLDALENRPTAAGMAQHCEIGRAAVRSLGGSVDEMLALAEASRRSFEPKLFDVSSYACSFLGTLARRDLEHRVHAKVEPGISCVGAEGLLRLIIRNLLTNAWKFTVPAQSPRIEVSACRDSHASFYVRDNGIGFDTARLWERGSTKGQVSSGRARCTGWGLGLNLVRQALRYHDGELSVDSSPGAGATFYVRLGGLSGDGT